MSNFNPGRLEKLSSLSFFSLLFLVQVLINKAFSASFTLEINRNMTCLDGSTIGSLSVDGQEVARTLELPWRNNESNISRIPAGSYDAFIRVDGQQGWRIQLKDIDDREFIQIHVGNYSSQIEGCILVGNGVEQNGNACMVTNSRATLTQISEKMSQYSAELGSNMSVPLEIKVSVSD